jgi:hypothetical protein
MRTNGGFCHPSGVDRLSACNSVADAGSGTDDSVIFALVSMPYRLWVLGMTLTVDIHLHRYGRG